MSTEELMPQLVNAASNKSAIRELSHQLKLVGFQRAKVGSVLFWAHIPFSYITVFSLSSGQFGDYGDMGDMN